MVLEMTLQSSQDRIEPNARHTDDAISNLHGRNIQSSSHPVTVHAATEYCLAAAQVIEEESCRNTHVRAQSRISK